MKIVGWIHYGVPFRRAGSETMLQTMMRALVRAGHEVLVVTSAMPEAPAEWVEDGVPYAQVDEKGAGDLIRGMSPDVVITHHNYADAAVTVARQIGARSVAVLHNEQGLPINIHGNAPDLIVYNTQWVMESMAEKWPEITRIAGIVIHPPVVPAEHRAMEGPKDRVTLVNISPDKGVYTWRGAAALLGDLPFLGVKGGHGIQVHRPVLRNMRIIAQTSNMAGDVWAHTRVLHVPSVYESYGMAAVEALASGTPVIAAPTLGLIEALGDAAVFIKREDVRGYVTHTRRLYADGGEREEMMGRALARSQFLADQTETEMKDWVRTVEALA